jgi:tRNA nucleotidyltransferase (CCA-adding enzyme)
METSPKRGTSSSNHQRSRSDAEAHLRHLIGRPPLKALITALSPAELYLVGGSVRDSFLTTADTDLDLATSLTALEVKERCDRRGIRIIQTGIQHGTVLAVIDEVHIEITTFRVPSSRDSHTTARDITTDLSGRDFTINALAFDVASHQCIDPFNGLSDLEHKIVRGVGSAEERFIEDPLRILRMIRFGDAQGRTIEHSTLAAAKKQVALLAKVSHERIKGELDKILISPFPHLGIRKIHEIGALPYTIPELIPSVGFEQNRFHIHDVFEHTLWVLERTPQDLILRWSAIFHDIGKPHTLSVDPDGSRHFYSHETVSETLSKKRMKELRFSTDDTRAIASIVRHHMRPLDCGAPGVRRIIRDLGPQLAQWRQFKAADSPPTFTDEEFQNVAGRFDQLLATELAKISGPSYGKLAISGEDLKALGVNPGPEMGKLIKELEELVIEDPAMNTKETLLAEATKRLA